MPLGILLLILLTLCFNFLAMLLAKRLCRLKGLPVKLAYWTLLYPGAVFLVLGAMKGTGDASTRKRPAYSVISIIAGIFLAPAQPFFFYSVWIMPFIGFGTI